MNVADRALDGLSFVLLVTLLGCGSEVRLDGEGGGTGSQATTGAVTSSGTSATASGSTGSGAFDFVSACSSSCVGECVAGPMSCLDACTNAAKDAKAWCGPEWIAAYACHLEDCAPDNDCTAEDDVLQDCTLIYCDLSCTETAVGCGCRSTQCDEGHTRRSECRASPTGSTMSCDCYENEALVYSCESQYGFCRRDVDCCDQYLRNGGA